MRTLDGLVGANGKPGRGRIDILVKGGEKALKEFTKHDELADGSTVKCYVLTAPGDIISVDITAGAQTADVFDLEVDGILRASLVSKALAKPFHGSINKVCYKAKAKPGKKGGDGAKYCGMKVQHRDASMDATFDRDGTPSAVSSLIIKAWRKKPAPGAAIEADVAQFFSWEEYASWKELKHYIKEGPKPPFEIDFIESTKLGKRQREKMDEIPKRDYSQYSLIATFIFELQSTSNLTTLGFEDVPVYAPTPLPAKPPRAKKEPKTKKTQAEVDDEDEDDGASTTGGLEDSKKDDGNVASVSDSDDEPEPRWVPKSKAFKLHSEKPKPKATKPAKSTKPKAPLATFEPPPSASEVLGLLMPYKPKTAPSKEEVSRSLAFSRAQLFSGVPLGTQNSSNEIIEAEALASTSDTTAAPYNADNTSVPIIPRDSKVEALSKENESTTGDASTPSRKGFVLHGEFGGPARRAFLARSNAQENESRLESDSQVDVATITNTTKMRPQNTFTAINHKVVWVADSMTRATSPVSETPAVEPLTPPVSAKKPLLSRDDLQDGHHFISSPTRSFSLPPSIELNKPSTFSQATTALTQYGPTQNSEPPVDLDKVVENLEAMSRKSGLITNRAASPALSEATEVADPMEVMESVRNSQRATFGSSDFQCEITDYYQKVSCEKSSRDTPGSPILGSLKHSSEDVSTLNIKSGDFREQVRESWQHKSPTPISSFSLPTEKRKADDITGQERLEYGEPRKTAVAPSLGQSRHEEKMAAAKAKLAAATERKLELEKKRRAAMDIKKQNDEVEALLRKAQEMEQSNADLEAEIVAILGSDGNV